MKLKKIIEDAVHSFIHLERYVNDGSPSGFTQKHTTSKSYDPFDGLPFFKLPLVQIPRSKVKLFGDIPQRYINIFSDSEKNIFFPLHPDCLERNYSYFKVFEIVESPFNVYPTASGRTVFIADGDNMFFLKLHYDEILCRAKRSLPFRKSVSGVEISNILKSEINNNFFDDNFSIFLENFSANTLAGGSDFGFVFRDAMPYKQNHKFMPTIPFFSLTGKDRKNPSDKLLLLQVLENFDNKKEIFLEMVIYPILSFYAKMITQLGLIPELNSQNMLLELNDNAAPSRLIVRDHMGTEKDITLREELGLSNDFISKGYKTIERRIDESLYFKRHSFHYDFKLCRYVIEPLTTCFSRHFGESLSNLTSNIKDKFIEEIGDFRFEYFQPYNRWYSHPKIFFTGKRPYTTHIDPLYR